jgi:hypothetical protein
MTGRRTNWEPLLAIADLAGGEWPKRAREAAMVLSGAVDGKDDNIRVQLLADIRGVFRNRSVDRFSSKDLVKYLTALEERPWAEYGQGKLLTKAKLSRLLQPFGVVSGTVRFPDGGTLKGYLLDQFTDAFERYLPPYTPSSPEDPPFKGAQRHNVGGARVSEDFENVTDGACYVSENGLKPSPDAACDVVTYSEALCRKGEAEDRDTGAI